MKPPKEAISTSVVVFNTETDMVSNLQTLTQWYSGDKESCTLDQFLNYNKTFSHKDADLIRRTIAEIIENGKPAARYMNCYLKRPTGQNEPCRIGFASANPSKYIELTFTNVYELRKETPMFDSLTGLRTRPAFTRDTDKLMQSLPPEAHPLCKMIYFDVQRFKIINDMFGTAEGDKLLVHIANILSDLVRENGISCRIGSDRFVLVTRLEDSALVPFIENLFEQISSFPLPIDIACNAGVYAFTAEPVSAEVAIGRAIMAQSTVKGSVTRPFHRYDEGMREQLFTEQEITGLMRNALKREEFIVYYQPQYNHATGMLVGAEALVRWLHPERGVISPGIFIPVFEKNGFITTLDLYVFERVCRFIRKCLDEHIHIVPISTNLTRYDIFAPNFIENLEKSRQKYNIPPEYLRIEITESAAIGNGQYINEAVRKLHNYGYVVEMDDFGSGYSSLNILKDIDFDMIKLDMNFLRSEHDNNRGGTILTSVVRMVNWLGLPVIAEGVETVEQADFLRSIGCNYIQGYLYSRPLPESAYHQLISGSTPSDASLPQFRLMEALNAANFWASESMETLIFSNFVGAAAIFDYRDGKTEILRVNKKYLREIGMNLSEKDLIHTDILALFDGDEREVYQKMLERAIETEDEQECETWRHLHSDCCGDEDICIRSTVRMIGKNKDSCLFYAMIRNITAEQLRFKEVFESDRRFRMASEQADMYAWEYNLVTKEMRPCFRCRRNLGLPEVLENYPESAIEMGIFPPEVADRYRNWLKQLENGAKYLDAVFPLTEQRIPFHVRYTTEFDETGRAIKAYASATLVVDKKD